MMELHQFRHSAFCLKIRMVLQAKGLSYRTVEVTPGLGQVALFRMSGQRQVPVLVDEDNVLADSSAIARYLEANYSEPRLIPNDPQEAAQVHLIEDWADTTLARGARSALLQAASLDADLRLVLLPEELPTPVRQVMGQMPLAWLNDISEISGQAERGELLTSLQKLAELVENTSWLVGDAMSLADLAVAAQLSFLCFPVSAGASLAGEGVLGLKDHPRLQPLFHWRDQLELSLTKIDSAGQ